MRHGRLSYEQSLKSRGVGKYAALPAIFGTRPSRQFGYLSGSTLVVEYVWRLRATMKQM